MDECFGTSHTVLETRLNQRRPAVENLHSQTLLVSK